MHDELKFCRSSLRLQGGSRVLDGVSLRRQAGGCQEDGSRHYQVGDPLVLRDAKLTSDLKRQVEGS